jgi:hypothetical protein
MCIRADDPSRAAPRDFFRFAGSVRDRDKPRDGNLAPCDRPAAGLEIAREVFETSDWTTVHIKDRASGPEGFLPFVRSIIRGLSDEIEQK